jgi:hypothetical protein
LRRPLLGNPLPLAPSGPRRAIESLRAADGGTKHLVDIQNVSKLTFTRSTLGSRDYIHTHLPPAVVGFKLAAAGSTGALSAEVAAPLPQADRGQGVLNVSVSVSVSVCLVWAGAFAAGKTAAGKTAGEAVVRDGHGPLAGICEVASAPLRVGAYAIGSLADRC